jgi:peroxiredoxin
LKKYDVLIIGAGIAGLYAAMQLPKSKKVLATEKMSGKPILINFWATSCPSCVEEIPHLSALYKELHDDGLEIIGVAMFYDPPQHVKNFTDQNQLPYPIAIDIQGEAAQAFGDILLTPTNFLIDPDGRIVKKKIGLMDIHALRQDILAMLNKPTDTP